MEWMDRGGRVSRGYAARLRRRRLARRTRPQAAAVPGTGMEVAWSESCMMKPPEEKFEITRTESKLVGEDQPFQVHSPVFGAARDRVDRSWPLRKNWTWPLEVAVLVVKKPPKTTTGMLKSY